MEIFMGACTPKEFLKALLRKGIWGSQDVWSSEARIATDTIAKTLKLRFICLHKLVFSYSQNYVISFYLNGSGQAWLRCRKAKFHWLKFPALTLNQSVFLHLSLVPTFPHHSLRRCCWQVLVPWTAENHCVLFRVIVTPPLSHILGHP